MALMLGGLLGGVDIKPDPFGKPSPGVAFAARLSIAALQTALHVVIAGAVIWLVVELASGLPTFWIWVLGLAVSYGAGAILGTSVFATFMLVLHKIRGEKAQACSNQVFTGQSIPDYKNLLRMRLGADGGLTIFPLGVDKACTSWELAYPKPAARFEPRGTKPAVHPIDRPLEFDAKGNRL